MASVPPPKRDRRPRTANVISSYKNSCGAKAPKATLKTNSGPTTTMKFADPKINSRSLIPAGPEGGTIVYTNSGPRLTPASVSDIIAFHLLTKDII